MQRHQREFENVPETRQTAPLRNEAVQTTDTSFLPGEIPPQGVIGSTARQPRQVYDTATQDNAMPPHNFVGDAAARDQAVSGDIDSYGTATAARHHPFTGGHHHDNVAVEPTAAGANTGVGTNPPTTSYVDPSRHRANVPVGTAAAGTTAANSAGVTGVVEPTTGEKIRGTVRQVVGELQGNPRKAAEGKALKEGTHPVQTGPYSSYTAGGGPRHI